MSEEFDTIDPDEPDDPDDPDRASRNEAFGFVGRRLAIFGVPLLLIGLLLVGLGIPWWITGGVVLVTLVILVFEVDV